MVTLPLLGFELVEEIEVVGENLIEKPPIDELLLLLLLVVLLVVYSATDFLR